MTEQSTLLTSLLERLDTNCPNTCRWIAADTDGISADVDRCQYIHIHTSLNDVLA